MTNDPSSREGREDYENIGVAAEEKTADRKEGNDRNASERQEQTRWRRTRVIRVGAPHLDTRYPPFAVAFSQMTRILLLDGL